MKHGNRKLFSVEGIRIVLDYWASRGHRVVGFLPEVGFLRLLPLSISIHATSMPKSESLARESHVPKAQATQRRPGQGKCAILFIDKR
jgi:hypothetical protein